MSDLYYDKPAKNEHKRACQNCNTFFFFHIHTEMCKTDSRQIQPEYNEKIIQIMCISARHKDRQQIQRITNAIIMQGRQNVSAISEAETIERHFQYMRRKQRPGNLSEPTSIVNQRFIVLHPPVRIPDQRLSVMIKRKKENACHYNKKNRIHNPKIT